jgi:hypothetical protein
MWLQNTDSDPLVLFCFVQINVGLFNQIYRVSHGTFSMGWVKAEIPTLMVTTG